MQINEPNKKHFFYKLIPPRTSFIQDMTEAEAKVMEDHASYWQNFVDGRIVIAFGPVIDPNGVFGMAIVELEDEKDARDLAVNDPAIKAGIGFTFEIYPMPDTILRK